MKRTVRVIEVSIYKWTRCPIFYVTLSRKEKISPKKQAEEKKYRILDRYVCVYVSYDGKRKKLQQEEKQGGKLNGEEV